MPCVFQDVLRQTTYDGDRKVSYTTKAYLGPSNVKSRELVTFTTMSVKRRHIHLATSSLFLPSTCHPSAPAATKASQLRAIICAIYTVVPFPTQTPMQSLPPCFGSQSSRGSSMQVWFGSSQGVPRNPPQASPKWVGGGLGGVVGAGMEGRLQCPGHGKGWLQWILGFGMQVEPGGHLGVSRVPQR